MSLLKRLVFLTWYFRRPPWDSGQTPPELLDFLKTRLPGRAVDLGCGTGTNAITLARLGWQTAGVDFVPKAVRLARKKAQNAGINADLRVGDVTKLEGFDGQFDLALDIGCFHSLSRTEKMAYLDQIGRKLKPGGAWFIYGFLSAGESAREIGITPADLDEIGSRFKQRSRIDGVDRESRPSAYFIFEKPLTGG